jgi:hypothetical protein
MSMREHRLRWLAVALVAAGCGLGFAWFVTRDTLLPRGSYRLVVYETNLGREAVYTEGFQSYLAVTAGAGGSTTVTVPRTAGPAFTKRLAPGRYIIKSWLRPCDGNCGTLDDSTDRCQLAVSLGPDQPTDYIVLLTPGHGCRVEPRLHGGTVGGTTPVEAGVR